MSVLRVEETLEHVILLSELRSGSGTVTRYISVIRGVLDELWRTFSNGVNHSGRQSEMWVGKVNYILWDGKAVHVPPPAISPVSPTSPMHAPL